MLGPAKHGFPVPFFSNCIFLTVLVRNICGVVFHVPIIVGSRMGDHGKHKCWLRTMSPSSWSHPLISVTHETTNCHETWLVHRCPLKHGVQTNEITRVLYGIAVKQTWKDHLQKSTMNPTDDFQSKKNKLNNFQHKIKNKKIQHNSIDGGFLGYHPRSDPEIIHHTCTWIHQ